LAHLYDRADEPDADLAWRARAVGNACPGLSPGRPAGRSDQHWLRGHPRR